MKVNRVHENLFYTLQIHSPLPCTEGSIVTSTLRRYAWAEDVSLHIRTDFKLKNTSWRISRVKGCISWIQQYPIRGSAGPRHKIG